MTTRFLATVSSILLLGAVGLAGSSVVGQTILAPSPIEQSMQTAPVSQGQTQRYDGVVPGSAAKNPLPAAPAGGPYLVWTGFQMTATGSRVFLQTTQPVQYDLSEGRVSRSGKSTLTVRLSECRIFMANNRRKIDTRYFATPVSSISARQKRHDIEVRIALREVAAGVPHVEPGPDGTHFVVIDFPPGRAAPEPSALSDMARASGIPDGSQEMTSEGADEAGASAGPRAPRSRR